MNGSTTGHQRKRPRRQWTLAGWQKMTDVPLAIAAALFLIGYALQILLDLPDGQLLAVDVFLALLWLTFGVDYVVSWSLAVNRRRWFWRHLHLLLMLILPVLRPCACCDCYRS